MSTKQRISGKSPAMPPPGLRKKTTTTKGNGNGKSNAITSAVATGEPGAGTGTSTGSVTVTGSLMANGTMVVSGDLKIVGMIESDFLKKLREIAFRTDASGTQIWPPAAVLKDTVAGRKLLSQEFMDAWDALFMRREKLVPVPTDGLPGTAKAMIKELIDATNWPELEADVAGQVPALVPEPWNTGPRRDAFRRYEVTCAMDILMRAFRNTGTGGSGESTGLPPDR